MPHRRSPPLPLLGVGRLSFGDALVEELSILVGSILGSFRMTALERDPVTLVLETLRGDQTLDLGSLCVYFLALALGLDFTTNDELANIIFLAETEEAAELGSTLGAEALGVDGVGDTGDVIVALLDDAESENREIHGNDAATNTLPLALSGATGTVAGVTLSEEKRHTGRVHNTLLHRETLLVVAAGDPEDVALELVADAVARDLMAHTAVHEDAELALIVNLDQLLCAIVGVGDVELHFDGRLSK